jgi:hypothetical protein
MYKARTVVGAMVLLIAMIACTCYSQFGIIPAMERDRVAAGGNISAADLSNPARIHFDRLHVISERVEEAILLMGLASVVLVARAETLRP